MTMAPRPQQLTGIGASPQHKDAVAAACPLPLGLPRRQRAVGGEAVWARMPRIEDAKPPVQPEASSPPCRWRRHANFRPVSCI